MSFSKKDLLVDWISVGLTRVPFDHQSVAVDDRTQEKNARKGLPMMGHRSYSGDQRAIFPSIFHTPVSERRQHSGVDRFQLLVVIATVAMALLGCGGGGGGSAPIADPYPSVVTAKATLLPSDSVGSAGKNYPFFSVDFDLKQFGYVQEEYTLEGKANVYDTPDPVGGIGNGTGKSPTAAVVTPDNPYKTRVIVIRPADAAKFNGTVLVEWLNVTSNYDIPVHWFQQKDMILRKGYAWVGVSAQSAGIANATTGLKAWSPARYGTLDVTNGGKVTGDRLSYDIYAQAAKAVRNASIMGPLAPKKVISVGASQSSGRLGIYFNSVHPLTNNVFDGALFSVGGPVMRSDLTVPIIKVLSQTELTNEAANEVTAMQPDTDNFRTWQVSGASHTDIYGLAVRSTILQRDLNQQVGDNCGSPSRSRVPIRYIFNSAIQQLEGYIGARTPMLKSPAMQVLTTSPPTVALDAYGNAQGGIRLPEFDVPIALDNGTNTGAGICFLNGTHLPFDKATLDALYPTKDAYVTKFTASANALVKAGFLLPEDAEESIATAQTSIVGERLTCGPLCADVAQFTKGPSSSLLRMHIFAYNLPDRASLLAPVDAATRYIATGYQNADPAAARMSYGQAIASLQQVATLIQAQADKQTISAQTAAYLMAQVNTLISALDKL